MSSYFDLAEMYDFVAYLSLNSLVFLWFLNMFLEAIQKSQSEYVVYVAFNRKLKLCWHEVKVLLGIHPSNYFKHQFDVKIFYSCQCQRLVKENVKFISLSKHKLECVKMQKLNGAIFLKHINTVKPNSSRQCTLHVPPFWANFVAW